MNYNIKVWLQIKRTNVNFGVRHASHGKITVFRSIADNTINAASGSEWKLNSAHLVVFPNAGTHNTIFFSEF